MAAKKNKSYVCPPKCESFEIPPKILNAELETIRKRREAVHPESSAEAQAEAKSDPKSEEPELKNNLVGLALSGGGIRSATFSLGVMQRLAKEGWLKHVDYLSTVSGGGYIGGSLTWLLNASRAFRTTSDKFPFRVGVVY